MKKYLTMMVALAVTLFSINSFAWDPPTTPAPASWISDTSGVLSASAHARLDAKLKQINQSSSNELAALVVPTLDGQTIEDVTNATFKAWGVGKKGLDNGVLVVLAMKEHKSRIETGKGVEGDLPDLKTQDILVQARPYLRKGDVEGALGFIFDSSASSIANHKADMAAGRSSGGSRPSCDVSGGVGAGSDSSLLFILATTAGLGLLFWYLSARTRRRHQQEEEAYAAIQRETARLRLQNANTERERQRKAEEARLQHLQASQPPPVIAPLTAQLKRVTHTSPHPITRDGEPVESVVESTRHVAPVVAAVAVAATATIAAAELERQRHHAEEARRKRERDEEDSRRRRREQDDEDRRRKQREDDDRSSSSSSSSSSDWSSGGSSGGFGGGDSGGGGSSGDW